MLAPIVTDRNKAPILPPDEDFIELLRSTDFDVRLQVSASCFFVSELRNVNYVAQFNVKVLK